MLKQLRDKKTAKKILIVLAIVIIPAFVFWGFSSAIRSQRESNYAGKIFEKKITLLEFKDAMEAIRNQAIMQFGDKFSEIQKYLNLESQAWERLILLYEAKKRKLKVNDQEVIELIQKYPFFQRNGRFDNSIYSQMLAYVFRTQPRIFEEQTRQNLMLAKLYEEITKDISLKDDEIKEEYRRVNEEISIFYLTALPADFTKDIIPSEAELKDYFLKNSLDFKQPLSFNLEYISADAEEKIKNIALGLDKKKDLAKVAEDFSLEIKETGLFTQTSPIPGIGWSGEIMGLISKLKIGEFSSPLHLDKSYYILKLKERREPYIPELEAIKDKVKQNYIDNRNKMLASEKIENCLKEIKRQYRIDPRAIDFNNLAKEFGLKSGATEPFKYGSYIEGVGASDNFWLAAQELQEDEFSDIIDTLSGFYIIKLKSKVPLDDKKFASEKTEFTQRLLAQKKQENFVKFLEDLKKKLRVF